MSCDMCRRLQEKLTLNEREHQDRLSLIEALTQDLEKLRAEALAPPAPESAADAAVSDLVRLIHGFVTGDGQQLENLDFDEGYWRGQADSDHLHVSIHVDNWLAMLEAMRLVLPPPPRAEARDKKD